MLCVPAEAKIGGPFEKRKAERRSCAHIRKCFHVYRLRDVRSKARPLLRGTFWKARGARKVLAVLARARERASVILMQHDGLQRFDFFRSSAAKRQAYLVIYAEESATEGPPQPSFVFEKDASTPPGFPIPLSIKHHRQRRPEDLKYMWL